MQAPTEDFELILAKEMSPLWPSLVPERNHRKECFHQTTETHTMPSRKTGHGKATPGCSQLGHALGNKSAPTSHRPGPGHPTSQAADHDHEGSPTASWIQSPRIYLTLSSVLQRRTTSDRVPA